MSWNLPRIINNLEAEINTGYVKDPATRDFSMAGYDIRNANLVKCNDVETNVVFSVNDELEKLNNFEATTTNPDVTTIVGKLNIENIDTNTIYDLSELTRIELNDNEVNIVTQNLTFNGQDVLTNANLETLENKTFYIDGSTISPNGTIFSNYIYADKFIINNGPSPAGYLLSDGTILNNSGDGVNSNIYLYNNNNTHTPIPANGQIRFNQPANADATQLYISHRTRDGIDIEDPFLSSISTLSIIYIQDQDVSENYIRFNVNSAPVIFPTSYVQLNVTFLDGGGNGLTTFGAGMNIFMSIFSNDIEIDTRLSNLETKCQNVEAISSKLTVNRSLELLLDEPDFFAIRSNDAFLNYLVLNPTVTMLYTNLNLNANNLSNVGSITISNHELDNFFIKSDGTLDENNYITATNSVITDLQAKTENITGTFSTTTITNNTMFKLGPLEGLYITDTSETVPIATFDNFATYIFKNLYMNDKAILNASGYSTISGLSTQFLKANGTVDSSAYITATNSVITNLQDKTQNIVASSTLNTITKSSQFKLSNTENFSITDDSGPFVQVTKLLVTTAGINVQCPLSMNTYQLSGIPTPINDDQCPNKLYVDTAIAGVSTNVTDIQTKTQNQSATASETQFGMNTACILRNGETDAFVVRSNSSVVRLKVDNTNVQLGNTLLMQGHRVQGVGLPISVGDAVSFGAINAGNVPYFTSDSRLSGAVKNAFVQLTNSTIQSAIDKATAGGNVGWSIEVSSGDATENIICGRQNYTIVGAICPPFTQTTQITGNLTIGSSGFLSTRVRVSHMKFVGNLIFDNSTNQQLRTYFYNCDWSGSITFPTSLATGTNGTAIYFNNCSFSGASAIVIPNQSLYTIFFTRCAFVGQTITNNQPVGNTTKTVFTDCSYLPTLTTLGNCILNGLNTTLSTTQANFGSIVLGGASTSFLMGNGSLNTATYATVSSLSFNLNIAGLTNVAVIMRKTVVGTVGTVALNIAGFAGTVGTTATILTSTNTITDASFRPQNGQVLGFAVRIRRNNVIQMGTLVVFASGSIGLMDVLETSNFWVSGNTGCGTVGDTCVTYTV